MSGAAVTSREPGTDFKGTPLVIVHSKCPSALIFEAMSHVAGAQTKKDVGQSEEEGSKDDAKNCAVKTTDKMEPSSSVRTRLSSVEWDVSVGTPHADEARVVGQKLATGTSRDSPVASGEEGAVAQAKYTMSTDEDAAEVPMLLPQQQLRLKLALKTGTAALQDSSWVEPQVVDDSHILLDLIEGAEHPPEEPAVTAVTAVTPVQQDVDVFVDVCLDVDRAENPCAKQPDKSPHTNQLPDVPAVPSLSSLAPLSSLPPTSPYHPPITPQTIISHKHILQPPQPPIIQRSVSYSAPQAADHSFVSSANPQSEKRPVENAQTPSTKTLANLNVESWDVSDVFAFLTELGQFSTLVVVVQFSFSSLVWDVSDVFAFVTALGKFSIMVVVVVV